MQVYKSFFKLLNSHKGQVIMYICIFVSLMLLFTNNSGKDNSNIWQKSKVEYALIDNDNSELSTAVVSYINETHNLCKNKINDNRSEIQDALYNREIEVFVKIPSGYQDSFINGGEAEIEVLTIPGTNPATFFESDLNSYLSKVSIYIKSGKDIKSAVEKASVANEIKIDAKLLGKDTLSRSARFNYFGYLGYVMLLVMIMGIAPIIQVYNGKEIRNRIECSSYKFVNLNKELILGVLTIGLGFCALFTVLAVILLGRTSYTIFDMGGLYNIINMVVYMTIGAAFAYLISAITDNDQILSMFSNVVALSMSFLCGVFVPLDLLSDGVVKVAHFLPAFWYIKVVSLIEEGTDNIIKPFLSYIGVELLFAIAIILAGMLISRRKRIA